MDRPAKVLVMLALAIAVALAATPFIGMTLTASELETVRTVCRNAAGGLLCLVVLLLLINWLRPRKGPAVSSEPYGLKNWYSVTFDSEKITQDVRPPGGKSWQQAFCWDRISRICFESHAPWDCSDGIHFYTDERPESYLVPLDAEGGDALWEEVINRGLFDPELAIEAAACPGEGLFCWPSVEERDSGHARLRRAP